MDKEHLDRNLYSVSPLSSSLHKLCINFSQSLDCKLPGVLQLRAPQFPVALYL
jgi:hypothetical protein